MRFSISFWLFSAPKENSERFISGCVHLSSNVLFPVRLLNTGVRQRGLENFKMTWILFFFPFIFISWRLITLQYRSGFCHTLTWISHGFTCVPHPDLPPTSLSIPSLWVFPVHQPRALVSCIQPGLAICFTLDSILVSMLFSQINDVNSWREENVCVKSVREVGFPGAYILRPYLRHINMTSPSSLWNILTLF